MAESTGLVDYRAISQCLGAIIDDPSLLDEYPFEKEDFVDQFHTLIFSAVSNLYNLGTNIIDIFSIDSYLSGFSEQYKIFNDSNGLSYVTDVSELYEKENFLYYFERMKKFSLLRYWQSKGFDTKRIYDPSIVDAKQQEEQRNKLDNLTVSDMIDAMDEAMVNEPKIRFISSTNHKGQLAGKGLRELKESFKETPDYGLPLQSPIMSTISRGCRLGKFYLRSSNSGGGKAIPNDTVIPTPIGYRRVGDIKVGDYLFDRQGNPTKVLAVYPQGKKRVYELTFSDGRKARCCKDHLWTYKKSYQGAKYITTSLKELIDDAEKGKNGFRNSGGRGNKYKIPINKAVQYKEKQYSIPPYVMGLLLGDGSFRYSDSQKALSYSSEDDFLPTQIANIMGWEWKKNIANNYSYCFEYKSVNSSAKKRNVWVEEILHDYPELWQKKSHEKFIPDDYLTGSIEQRLDLLRGLLDTDGAVESKGRVSFSTTSPMMRDGFLELCRSLGIIASYGIDGRKKYANGEAYDVRVQCLIEKKLDLFRLPKHLKKLKEWQEVSKNKKGLRKCEEVGILDIQKTDEFKEMTCFTVDNEESLFLMNDFIVTHNTRTGLADMANISVPYRYNLKTKKWDYTGFSEPVLMISTELEFDEIQTILAAYVSGVNEAHIREGTYLPGEEERVDKAIEYIESSPFYIEHIPNFGIKDIIQLIKKYKREKSVYYFFFDYIHMSNKLIMEVSSMSNGMKLREDQILFLFADALKNVCNELRIFVLSSTQLNGTYKDSAEKDETMLRGAKSLADRLDMGEISLDVSPAEAKMLEKITKNMIGMPEPNLIRHIYKLRGNKWSKIKVVQHVDLGTGRTEDLFVLNKRNELIDIPVVDLRSVEAEKSKEVEKIIQSNSESIHSMPEDFDIDTDLRVSESENQKPAHKYDFDF